METVSRIKTPKLLLATPYRAVVVLSALETQKKFEVSGASYDPNTIAMLLAQHPYHLESLLALAELYKQLGEYQQSVECLERCIFALECAWHPLFFPFDCTCRLPFSCDTNRPFFFALLKFSFLVPRHACPIFIMCPNYFSLLGVLGSWGLGFGPMQLFM